MIYGANGYTGQLAARQALRRGESPILAGRNAAAISRIADELGMQARVFDLHDTTTLTKNLSDVAAVLHCAGPFSATSESMLDACLRTGTHYLDITGEIAVFEAIFARDQEIRSAGIVAMPGVGMDVVPTDCLAAMLKRELPSATRLRLALYWHNARLSPGTSKTMVEGVPHGGKVRRNGKIITVPPAWKKDTFRFRNDVELSGVTIPWGDVSTAYHSTGIPDIEVYLAAPERQLAKLNIPAFVRWLLGLTPVQAFVKRRIEKSVKGPNEEQRARAEVLIYGEVEDDQGNKAALRLRTAEGYTLTAEAAVEAAMRVTSGSVEAGAKTPSVAFGSDFILELDGSRLETVAA